MKKIELLNASVLFQPTISHLSSQPVSVLGTKTCYSLPLLSTAPSRYQVITAWISQPQDPAATVATRNLTPWSPVSGQRSAGRGLGHGLDIPPCPVCVCAGRPGRWSAWSDPGSSSCWNHCDDFLAACSC